jgi:hypothetical protein
LQPPFSQRRIEYCGRACGIGGLLRLPKNVESARQIGMGISEFRVEFDGPRNQGQGFLRLATVLPDQAKETERFRVIGLEAQNLLIKLFRAIEVARRVAANGRVKEGVDINIL